MYTRRLGLTILNILSMYSNMATIISSSVSGAGLSNNEREREELALNRIIIKWPSLSLVFRMAARVNDPVHVQVEIIEFNFIRIR